MKFEQQMMFHAKRLINGLVRRFTKLNLEAGDFEFEWDVNDEYLVLRILPKDDYTKLALVKIKEARIGEELKKG